ncbi:MAG: hypothetical protein ACE5GX_18630 [Thermoanaerobaculia bacterium]
MLSKSLRAAILCALLAPVAFASDLPTESSQFDFWIGTWNVNLRILQKEDLSWRDSVAAEARIYPVLDGKAILELWDSKPIKGFSLRYFDSAKDTWVLWLNWPKANRAGLSSLEGGFRHGRGDFYSTTPQADGSELVSRFSFNDITPKSLRWDDAYSKDGGRTWTHNWIMEFTRTAAMPSWPAPGQPAHTFETGGRCDRAEFRAYEFLAGARSGRIEVRDESGGWQASDASLRGYRILDGCAVVSFLETFRGDEPHKVFSHMTFNAGKDAIEQGRLTGEPESGLELYLGGAVQDGLEMVRKAPADVSAVDRKILWLAREDGGVEMRVLVGSDRRGWREVERGLFR